MDVPAFQIFEHDAEIGQNGRFGIGSDAMCDKFKDAPRFNRNYEKKKRLEINNLKRLKQSIRVVIKASKDKLVSNATKWVAILIPKNKTK